MNTENTIIGIDLATTYCSVAVYKDGRPEIILDENGSTSFPSYVAFTDEGHLVGSSAKNQASMNHKNTIYDSKRFIGRQYSDLEVQQLINIVPFTVLKSNNNNILFEITHKGEIKHLSPEDIASLLIQKMKQMAEEYLGFPIKYAIISVPAYFNDTQKTATQAAAQIANIEC